MRRRYWSLFVVVVALTPTIFGIAWAASGGAYATASRKEAASPSHVTRVKKIGAAYPIRFVFYATETCPLQNPCRPYSTKSESWVDLPRATITVPVGGNLAVIFSRFTAESECFGGDGYCSARVMIQEPGGAVYPMEPNAGVNLSFDSNGTDQWESHSIEQVIPGNVPAGNYNVWVRVSTHPFGGSSTRPTFYLDNWTFTAQAAW